MKGTTLKLTCLVAALYFGMEVDAQRVAGDTATKERKIEEVVMIGYGSRKKSDNTTSISSLNSDQVNQTKVLNATAAVQGKIAGVNIVTADDPNSSPVMLIRGISSMQNQSVLYIVDGVPMDNINNLSSTDIQSYDVLKDASALAIYGTRASGGVVIITTKSGRGRKLTVDFDSNTGFKEILHSVKMADANEYARYSNVAAGYTRFSENQPNSTDWLKQITQGGEYYNNNVSVYGSSDAAKYFFSAGYYNEKGILKGMDFNRITTRSNTEFKISKAFTLRENIQASFSNTTYKDYSVFTEAYKQSPLVPVYFANGRYGTAMVGDNGLADPNGKSFNNVGNPMADLTLWNQKGKDFNLMGSVALDVQIFSPLKFTTQFSGQYDNYSSYNFNNNLAHWLVSNPTMESSDFTGQYRNTLNTFKSTDYNWNQTNYFTFNKVFREIHDVEATVGEELSVRYFGYPATYLNYERTNLPENSNYWNLGTSDNQVNYLNNTTKLYSVNTNAWRTLSFFGRLQYKLLNRYLLTATVREDGSSQFSSGHKWGTFPSFGLGWIVSNEDFLKGNDFLTLLKLRGGWGKMGNANVPLNVLSFTGGLVYANQSNGSTMQMNIFPNLSWEVTKETSGGIDFELVHNLRGSVDVYRKVTENAIFNIANFSTSGITASTPAPIGQISNKGVEASLRWDKRIGDNFSYWIGGNYSYNKNNLDSFAPGSNIPPQWEGGLGNGQNTKYLGPEAVGRPLGSFYLYDYAGVDNVGQMLYYTTDGHKVTQDNLQQKDRKWYGSVLAPNNYGVNLGFKYKKFDFSADGYGTFGGKIYNGMKAQRFGNENITAAVASNYWSSGNTSSANPAPFNQVPAASTYYLENSNFFRINNITLGYTLDKFSSAISSMRLYIQAVHPFIFTKYSGFSPEVSGPTMNPDTRQRYNNSVTDMMGVELNAYPTLRTFVIGANIKF